MSASTYFFISDYCSVDSNRTANFRQIIFKNCHIDCNFGGIAISALHFKRVRQIIAVIVSVCYNVNWYLVKWASVNRFGTLQNCTKIHVLHIQHRQFSILFRCEAYLKCHRLEDIYGRKKIDAHLNTLYIFRYIQGPIKIEFAIFSQRDTCSAFDHNCWIIGTICKADQLRIVSIL